ncbi:MAG: hypothetical protein HYX69_06915 [Planctomycetia bacterium]|nr:hypothetical protein [Planctomycetia bacterium]
MKPGTLQLVYGVTCFDLDCAYHDSLHTASERQAHRTARELGWQVVDGHWLCPMCARVEGAAAPTAFAIVNGNGQAPGRKAVRA